MQVYFEDQFISENRKMDSVKYRMLGAHLANENLVITSLVPPRHTINEWNENLRFNTNLSEAQEKLGHRVLS